MDPFEYRFESEIMQFDRVHDLRFVASMLLQLCRLVFLMCDGRMDRFHQHISIMSSTASALTNMEHMCRDFRRIAPRFPIPASGASVFDYLMHCSSLMPSVVDRRGRIIFDHQKTVDHVIGQLELYAKLMEQLPLKKMLHHPQVVEMIGFYKTIQDFRPQTGSLVLIGHEAFASWTHEYVRMPDVRFAVTSVNTELLLQGLRPQMITSPQFGLMMLQPTQSGSMEDAKRVSEIWRDKGVNVARTLESASSSGDHNNNNHNSKTVMWDLQSGGFPTVATSSSSSSSATAMASDEKARKKKSKKKDNLATTSAVSSETPNGVVDLVRESSSGKVMSMLRLIPQ
jgi:hypothetical protein